MKSQLKLTLLENSRSFFAEALHKAILAEKDVHQWKFAIFNMCQAIELSLKEGLRREHPALILENLDRGVRTVAPKQAIIRLRKYCDIEITDKDIAVIDNAVKWRNEIVHSEFSLNAVQLKSAFSTLIGFLRTYHEEVFNERLSDKVDEVLWEEAVLTQEYGEELVRRAKKRMADEDISIDDVTWCGLCGEDVCVILESVSRCYACGREEELQECEACGCKLPESQIETRFSGISGPDGELHGWNIGICQTCIDEGKY